MLSQIKILPQLLAEKIAAGEVIERPASIVKELLENSIDAQATEIQIVLAEGGKTLIEVTDNGTGMSLDDLKLSPQRHATSKIGTLNDLENIRTLGFRGEALPSIAAVSQLKIISKNTEAQSSYELYCTPFPPYFETRAINQGHFLGSSHGTIVKSENLFFQIPARLKFLKSKSSEISHVREWTEKLAIAYPHIGFKLISDGKTILNFRPEDISSRIQTVLSEEDTIPLIHSSHELDDFKISLYWLQGHSLPQTRKLFQIVNKRVVKDRLLQQALLFNFKQVLMPGQFPAIVLYLDLPPAHLDVNVHPTKTEIRFLESSKIFRLIESSVSKMISEQGHPAYIKSSQFDQPQTYSSPTYFSAYFNRQNNFQNTSTNTETLYSQDQDFTQLDLSGEQNSSLKNLMTYAQYVGSLFNTYMVFELNGEEIILLDQHAVHERIRYEKLKNIIHKLAPAESQALLLPEAVHFPIETKKQIEQSIPALKQIGFETEIFGENTLLFRAIPTPWENFALKQRLQNLVEKLIEIENQDLLLDHELFEKIASDACHSAVRAGDPLKKEQVCSLLHDLENCENPWNCPHGRPTVLRIPKTRIEQWFQRKI
ncbi:MAG: DNA mismatch repair endonuclease MutL [Deltaproteobacteria bacterium]|nr:DNA mismatch repair endonuclease MutL [Deltaproteobacteria bacterium]